MSKAPIKTNSDKVQRITISQETRDLWEQRDQSLDNDPDAPQLPPEM